MCSVINITLFLLGHLNTANFVHSHFFKNTFLHFDDVTVQDHRRHFDSLYTFRKWINRLMSVLLWHIPSNNLIKMDCKGKYKYTNKVLEIFRWFFITTFVEQTYWISWQSYLSIIYLNIKYLLIIFGEIYFLVSNTIVSILEEEKGNWFVKQKNLHQYLVWPLAA